MKEPSKTSLKLEKAKKNEIIAKNDEYNEKYDDQKIGRG